MRLGTIVGWLVAPTLVGVSTGAIVEFVAVKLTVTFVGDFEGATVSDEFNWFATVGTCVAGMVDVAFIVTLFELVGIVV